MDTFQRPIRIPASKLPLALNSARTKNSGNQFSRPLNTRRSIRLTPQLTQFPASRLHADASSISLTLPVPPSVNHQYATVNGRRLLSSAGRAYKAHVGQLVWLTLTQSAHRSTLLSRFQTESLSLSIRFYFTSALRRDVDGGLKIAQDALCEGLGVNDNRIVETHLYKNVDKTYPRMEVFLSALAPA